MPPNLTVFISSTSEDLKEHREIAAKAAMASGLKPIMMEYFPASGHQPSLPACLEKVDEAAVVVVLVAHRYGWVPDDPTNPDAKSITSLECEHARQTKKEVLAFLVDPKQPWPREQYEDYRLLQNKKLPARKYNQLRKEVQRNETKLNQFKNQLSTYFRTTFNDAASVRAPISEALAEWRRRHHPTTSGPWDPEGYLQFLEDDTRQIRIKGLKTKRAEPYFFGIDEIYVPLTTLVSPEMKPAEQPRAILVEVTLAHKKVVMVGDPGAGKSTFLRRVAFELCRNLRGTRPDGAPPFLKEDDKRFPILIRVAELAKFLASDPSPKPPDSPDWIPYFLSKQSAEYKWNPGQDHDQAGEFFRHKLESGQCLVMIDGLDEAPDRRLRERIARLFEKATRSFNKCDFLISTRPQTNVGDAVLEGFHAVRIGDLRPESVETFIDHFTRALALNDAEEKGFKQGLQLAIESRPEIRKMTANPVMLTALAVLQHNDQKLPEYRVELYGSILGWLAAAREHKDGRPAAEKCLEYMRKLALRMQHSPSGRQVQVNRREAAEYLTVKFGGEEEANEELLERETHESGILSSGGPDLKFWHLSFQEYLAAREIVGLAEQEQVATVIGSGNLYLSEWRETMRLLGALMKLQGEGKIEWLFKAILERLGDSPTLEQQVRCAALLGEMMRDLKPMGYQPKTPDYEQTVKAVVGIFDVKAAESIDLKTRIEAADALGQVGDPRLNEQNNWVEIPAGTFLMGAQSEDEKGRNYDAYPYDDEVLHNVRLKAFLIQRYAVTVQEFAAFIAAGGYSDRKHWHKEGFGKFHGPADWEQQQQFPNRPVVGVNWFEAAAYCAYKGCRLPTEAEWERAARGPENYRYPWGNSPELDASHANHSMEVGHPTPVGLYPKGNTSERLSDMLDNVWEWCIDWYGEYDRANNENPRGPETGHGRVMRGGAWFVDPLLNRVSYRNRSGPSLRFTIVGFRCAADID